MDLFDLVAKIRLDSSEYESDVSKAKGAFSTLASGVKNGLTTVAKVGAAAVTAGAAGIAALTKMGIEGYAQYEQLAGGAELLWGNAYTFIANQASNAYRTVQMSQSEYLQQVNGFAVGLRTALGENEQAAAELADRIITAEADIVAATGATQENVQNAFNGIMKGNFSMIDNLGLGVTATKEGFQTMIDSVNAYNAEHGKATKYQIDNVADCQMALLDYIEMQGMAGYAGMEAAGTIEGALAMMRASWQNLVVGMADSTADIDTLINNFVSSASTAARLIVPKLAQVLGGITTAMAEIIPVVTAELPGLMGELLPGLIEGSVTLVSSLISIAPDIVGTLISAIGQFVTEKIPEMFPGLADSISVLQSYFTDIGNYMVESFAPIFADVSSAFTAVKDAVQPVIDNLVSYVSSGEAAKDASDLLKGAIDFVSEAYGTVKGAIEDASTAISSACDWVTEHQVGLEILASAIGVVTSAVVAYNAAQLLANAGGIAGIAADAALTVGYYALVAAETVATAATSAFGAVMAFVTSPIALVTAAIAAVIAIIVLCVKHWDEITAAVSSAWASIKEATAEATAAVGAWISEKFEAAKAKTTEIFNSIKEAISTAWDAIKSGVSNAVDAVGTAISTAWDNVKSATSTAFNAVLTTVTTIWNSVTSAISNAINTVKSAISTGLESASSTVSSVLDTIKSKFSTIFEGAKEIVTSAISAIKGAFNFSWSLPKLSLPHISVSGGVPPYGIGGEGSLPSFSISWYKKAMNNAMVLSNPTIFGYSSESGKFLGGGDGNGNEVIAGESYLMRMISNAVAAQMGGATRGVTVNQYIQSVPQTPVEMAAATEAYFEQARWML